MTDKLDPNGRLVLPGKMIPSFRTALAIANGVENSILFKTWGGI